MFANRSEDVEEDDTVWKNTRARLPWLLIGIFGGMLSARFMGFFGAEIAKITAIAFFVPLIQATGGNVGIQSSSLIVQSLVSPGFVDEGLWKRLSKAFSVALLNGFFLSRHLGLGGSFSVVPQEGLPEPLGVQMLSPFFLLRAHCSLRLARRLIGFNTW